MMPRKRLVNHHSEQARERNLLRELENLKEDRDRLMERFDAAIERADSANVKSEGLVRQVKQAAYVNEQLRKDLEKARSSLQARMSQSIISRTHFKYVCVLCLTLQSL